MSLMIPDIVRWPISELTRFTFAEVRLLLSLSCTLLSACSSCRSLSVLWTSSPPCVPSVWESSGDRGTQSSSCVCVSVHIFLWVFFLNDIQASQDGWNGVTARFSHIIFSFCPCLHSSNPTGVVYGSVWQGKKTVFKREGEGLPAFHFLFFLWW